MITTLIYKYPGYSGLLLQMLMLCISMSLGQVQYTIYHFSVQEMKVSSLIVHMKNILITSQTVAITGMLGCDVLQVQSQ